jgi:plastocyanin
MHFHVPLFLLPALAAAKTINIQVGASGLSYSPDSTTAAAGDVLNFQISSGHTVSQAAFSKPCAPINDSAIFSGTGAQTFAVTVNDTNPLWFYCSTPTHCSSGMVFAVNPSYAHAPSPVPWKPS